MSLVTDPVILDSTGQDIVTQLATISAALAAGNIVTGNTDTTLSGVLQGANGKVAVKPVDSDPTADSTNLVSSGGTDKAIKGRVPVYGKGVNLLRNAYFVGGGTGRGVFPVNQRGVISGTTANNTYGIDAWKWTYDTRAGSWALNSTGLTLTPDSASDTVQMLEYLKSTSELNGKSITASILRSDGTLKHGTITRNSSITQFIVDESDVGLRIFADGNFRIYVRTTQTIVAVKLELGTEQTLCHNEGTAEAPVWVLNEVPDYEYELYRCMTSTADSTDTFANKTLATNDDVSVVPITVIPSSNIDTSILPFANYSYRVGRQVFINVSFSPAIARIQGQSFCAVPSALCPTQNFPVIASVVMRRTTTSKTWSAIATVYSTGRIGFPNQGGYDETNSLTNDAVIYIQGTYYI